jgi:hypothetical protein
MNNSSKTITFAGVASVMAGLVQGLLQHHWGLGGSLIVVGAALLLMGFLKRPRA